MSLVLHHPDYRRTWMFPRNKRRLVPWQIAMSLNILNQKKYSKHIAEAQDVQDMFIEALEFEEVKEKRGGYHPKSGGARTYMAQLNQLGLVFWRGRKLYLTLAGEALASGQPGIPVLQSNLLRLQFPSAYSQGGNVKIHPGIRVRPFIFLMRLIRELGYLTSDEITIPVVFGHNDGCFDLCAETITVFRDGEQLSTLIKSPDALYTPRTKKRPFQKALEDARGDIANTAKNYLQGAGLISPVPGTFPERYTLTADAESLLSEFLDNPEDYIPVTKNTKEYFQRRFGRYDRMKDTRSLEDIENQRISGSKARIRAHLIGEMTYSRLTEHPRQFEKKMLRHGFKQEDIQSVVSELLPKADSVFDQQYLAYARSGGTESRAYEKMTETLFRDCLQFEAVRTGDMKRPGAQRGEGNFSDVFVIALDDLHCGIIEAKASGWYTLPSGDYAKMRSTYIPTYESLPNAEGKKLEFVLYTAGGLDSNIDASLSNLTKEKNVPVSAVSAEHLLDLCRKKPNQLNVRKLFQNGRILDSADIENI